ncbi:hypothetical protein M231_04430 [Tremella mesenterica]|uniref:Spt20-like SEP domain-containing protein n=1 Tax=Tremella mesenterica TaxID=5217 RepID=A0A4Q1BKE0_TREME|nr:uncharacterized protein TREMEDRAFT_29065 [Tremella mesenterica DSM 1558]EIW70571.1 hypothetical protein TREMEDRAFT_29065 [Tremella mesenterica DSM 1558]RXK38258.1 hypothetical protein M231_04430 [Tremella mesenterica]
MASASGYNHHRFARAVLKKSRKWEPSLTVQLYAKNWRFENSPVTFTYDGPMKPFLLALRSQVIPSSLMPFLYDIQPPVSFVDGCLVVEIQDFRKEPEGRSRVVMRPAAETLSYTIDSMLERKGQDWDEKMRLELESRIIAATSPPLYLGTSILASRNATLAMAITTPAGPHLSADGGYRPEVPETDTSNETERMRKLFFAGGKDRDHTAPYQPSWSILSLKERLAEAARQDIGNSVSGSVGNVNNNNGNNGQNNGEGEEKKKKKKRPVPDGEEEKKVSKKKKKVIQPVEEKIKVEEKGESKPKKKKPKKKDVEQ